MVTAGMAMFQDGAGLVQSLAPAMIIGKMVATARAQACRYMGFHPPPDPPSKLGSFRGGLM